MYKKCTSNHAISRQREIEDGLLEYMLHKSYDQITVINLCEKLGIPRKTFIDILAAKKAHYTPL